MHKMQTTSMEEFIKLISFWLYIYRKIIVLRFQNRVQMFIEWKKMKYYTFWMMDIDIESIHNTPSA